MGFFMGFLLVRFGRHRVYFSSNRPPRPPLCLTNTRPLRCTSVEEFSFRFVCFFFACLFRRPAAATTQPVLIYIYFSCVCHILLYMRAWSPVVVFAVAVVIVAAAAASVNAVLSMFGAGCLLLLKVVVVVVSHSVVPSARCAAESSRLSRLYSSSDCTASRASLVIPACDTRDAGASSGTLRSSPPAANTITHTPGMREVGTCL